MQLIIDIAGWIGGVEIILAYALVSFKKLKVDDWSYQVLNLTGSLFLIANTWYYRAYPSTIVNVVWAGIAVYTMMRFRAKRDEVKD